MNFSALQAITDTNQWIVLWPEVTLGLIALLLLVLELLLPKNRHDSIPRVAIFGQLLVLIGLLWYLSFEGLDPTLAGMTDTSFFQGMIVLTPTGQAGRVLILLTSVMVCYLASLYFKKQALPRIEFYHLVLVVTAAMMLLVQSAQFVLLFVTLETVTVGFYILVAYCRSSPLSLEAGLKYLILGALSSAILLFGIVLLCGTAGTLVPAGTKVAQDTMNFSTLGPIIFEHSTNPLLLVGAAMVLCGIAFKIGAVPFQIWIADVYQGAPTPTTAFLAVASKTAGFLVLLNLVTGPFAPLGKHLVVPLLSTLAVLSILFGNLAALTQRNVKRLMGLSGISHAGYLLIGVVAAAKDPGVSWATGAVLFYLFTYLLGSLAVFGVMAHVAGAQDEAQELENYADLGKRQPFLGGVLAIGLGSLAGIPPLAGFIGKLLIFIAAYRAGLFGLLGVAIVGVVISIYYYFGWMREALFRVAGIAGLPETSAEDLPRTPSSWSRITLGLLAGAALFVGLYQGFFADVLR